MSWWSPDWPLHPDETWEHAFVGNGTTRDCLKCHEGRNFYLHDGLERGSVCTICLYFGELRAAVTAYTRSAVGDLVGVPVWYCSNHFTHVDVELYLLNVARHAKVDPTELLEAYHS